MQEPPRPPKLVILYVMDALRADHLGHLGGPKEISPTIDRLAEQGASFRNHFSVAPNTVPSMKSLFTGQKFLLKGGYKLSPTSGPTLAERFSAAGYRTGLFSGNGNVSSWRGLTRGFEFTAQRVLWTGSSSRHDVGYNNNAEQVHNATLEWLDTLGEGHKAFVHIQTIHPHNPYDPPEPFLTRFVPKNESTVDGRTDTLKSIRTQRLEVSEADKERLKGLYAAGVAYNDAHIGKFIEAILERYEENEILLVITSDHGEELFEHGGILHGYTLYEEMLHIPLVVWWPGRVARREIVAATDNVDLHATLAALADFGGSTSTERDDANAGGISLWGYLTGTLKPDRAQKDVIFAAASAVRGGIFMARSERYKWIWAPRRGSRGGGRWGMGQGLGRGYDAEYLFDLVRDPEETTNLAGATALEGDWLRARLDAWIEAGIRLESGESLGEMDEETRKSLRALGYLQ